MYLSRMPKRPENIVVITIAVLGRDPATCFQKLLSVETGLIARSRMEEAHAPTTSAPSTSNQP